MATRVDDAGSELVEDAQRDAGAAVACSDLYNRIATASRAVIAAADPSCSSDDDCAFATVPTCLSCPRVVLAKAAAKEVATQVEAATGELCVELGAECPPTPPACGPAMTATCIFGRCEAITLGLPNCRQRRFMAIKANQALVDSADKSCRTDADCAAAPVATCTGECGFGAISTSSVEAIESQLIGVESKLCEPLGGSRCPLPLTSCPASGTPICKAGECILQASNDEG